jgi:hypothetical protein
MYAEGVAQAMLADQLGSGTSPSASYEARGGGSVYRHGHAAAGEQGRASPARGLRTILSRLIA